MREYWLLTYNRLMSVEEARVKILNLAAEVAETEDYNVPIRLKQLQGISERVINS